ncbi:MAG: hypothetical protein ABSF85_17225 [Terriglobales bacterium]|jgi:hypothetical protein
MNKQSDSISVYFSLNEQTISRSIAINLNYPYVPGILVAALALTGREAEAREALQRYLALRSAGLRTITAWKAFGARLTNPQTDDALSNCGTG